MSYRELDVNWLEEIIVPAIDEFYTTARDKDLIIRNASERAVVANLFCKMDRVFACKQLQNGILQQLSIDVEYNRNYDDSKRVYGKCNWCTQQGCFIKEQGFIETDMSPDILIHNRGTNVDNQVAIEFKKVSNRDAEERRKDKAKLIYLTCQQPFEGNEKKNYKYRYGFFIDLGIDKYAITPFIDTSAQAIRYRQGGAWV